ncbi:hypothetical protein [Immundisolibacter sp.]|uniref:DODA-type extradiol aromatic ring-opening family dioxygenase n=1 Tax=Immundisolibacter sp. TaxID=1934948 RepID=UPI00356503C0
MATVVGGLATSHAFALVDPDIWARGIAGNQKLYAHRYGYEPPLHPLAAQETLPDNKRRFARVAAGHTRLAAWLANNVDVLLLVGDDQDEQFGPENLPALAIFDGPEFSCRDLFHPEAGATTYRCHAGMAEELLSQATAADFDVSVMHELRNGELKAHAFGPVLRRLDPAARLQVIPVFVEGIHYPAPSPRRCYEFGRTLRRAVDSFDVNLRVAVCASGGMSHFSAAFPYAALEKVSAAPGKYGDIREAFDRQVLTLLQAGKGKELSNLTNTDLLEQGDVELRSWLVALGFLGDGVVAQVLAYEPFYSCITGVSVVHWPQVTAA